MDLMSAQHARLMIDARLAKRKSSGSPTGSARPDSPNDDAGSGSPSTLGDRAARMAEPGLAASPWPPSPKHPSSIPPSRSRRSSRRPPTGCPSSA